MPDSPSAEKDADSSSTIAEISACLSTLLERISAAERRTATQDAAVHAAETEWKAATALSDAALAEVEQAKAACRELRQATGEIEAERDDIARMLGDKRRELTRSIDEAIEAVKKDSEARAKAKLEQKAALAGRIEVVGEQLAAAEKQWAVEARTNHLEERLLVARLAEGDGKLREALLQLRSREVCAEERKHLRSMERQWAQLEAVVAKTDATMSQHDEQVAAVAADADKLEEERDALTAKLAKTDAKRTKALNRTLPSLAARLAAVEAEQQRLKDDCRDLQRMLVEARASKAGS
jgi:chromosome segregation ATPase